MPVLERMAEIGMPLCVHGEVTRPDVDIFDREAVFIETVLEPLRRRLPDLRVVLEHVTTRDGVDYVRSSTGGLAATITTHHLIINRNAILAGGIRPHYYCLPVAKRETHRLALRAAATSADARFFLGTDSAPHVDPLKESACGCAGIFTATNTMSLLAHVFEEEDALDRLEGFASLNGPGFYRSAGQRGDDHAAQAKRAGGFPGEDRNRRRTGHRLRSDDACPLGSRLRPWHRCGDAAKQSGDRKIEEKRMFSNSFPDKAVMADLAARMLLEIKAVHFRADEPYRLTSGLASPVYIDCRKLISFPRIRSALMDFATATILREAGFEQFDSVAGGETAGIPFAAWISERMGLPMQYIRKKPKGFGRNAQIEGEMPEGSRVLLVEDLTTDGGSKIKFAEAIRSAGAEIGHAFALFYYDIFPEAPKRLADKGITLHYLTTWQNVLAAARQERLFDAETLDQVGAFLGAPLEWSARNGGISELPAL